MINTKLWDVDHVDPEVVVPKNQVPPGVEVMGPVEQVDVIK